MLLLRAVIDALIRRMADIRSIIKEERDRISPAIDALELLRLSVANRVGALWPSDRRLVGEIFHYALTPVRVLTCKGPAVEEGFPVPKRP